MPIDSYISLGRNREIVNPRARECILNRDRAKAPKGMQPEVCKFTRSMLAAGRVWLN